MRSDWHNVPLRELISYYSKGIAPSYADKHCNNSIVVLNQKCNKDYRINYTAARKNDLNKKKVPQERILQPGDILINSTGTGTAGRVAQIHVTPFPATVDGHMIILRGNGLIDNLYLGYALKNKQLQIESLAEGSTGQTEINKARLFSEVRISYPANRDTQKAIGKLLYLLDQKIESNEQIMYNLLQQAKSIYRAWFSDFVIFGGVKPDDWKMVTLHELSSLITRGVSPKYCDVSNEIIINQKCIRNQMLDTALARAHTPKVINEKWLKHGDLLINSTGEGTLGRAAQVWFWPKNMTVDSHITIVRPKLNELVFYIGIWGILHEKEIEALHTGSTGQTELPKDRLKAMEILLPDGNSLKNFNGIIQPMTEIIISIQEENRKIESIRNYLLPRLMSGEIDVTDIQL